MNKTNILLCIFNILIFAIVGSIFGPAHHIVFVLGVAIGGFEGIIFGGNNE